MKSQSNTKGACCTADLSSGRDPERKRLRLHPDPPPYLYFLLWGFYLLLSPGFVATQGLAVPAGVEIRMEADPETAAVGDPIRIDLEVTTPGGYTVEIMEPESQAGDFFILDFSPASVVAGSDGSGRQEQGTDRQKHHARILAAVYKTGTFTFPAIPIAITDDRGLKTEIDSASVEIEIRSILAENDTDLRDMKEQAEIPGEIPWLLMALLAATFCILGAAAWYVRRKFRKNSPSAPPIPDRDPLAVAEEELQDLIARKLPENGHTKKYYVLLSEIVKRILTAAYGINTEERTTIEIMDSLYRHSGLGREAPDSIHSLLLQCDIVKFAKYIPSKSENDRAAEEAFRSLDRAREYSRQSTADSDEITEGPEGPGKKL